MLWGIAASSWLAPEQRPKMQRRMGRQSVAHDGFVTAEYAVPTAASKPAGIAPGPDGAMWFAEGDGGKIGRITLAGRVTTGDLPASEVRPAGITAGPDGNLWFTEARRHQ